MMYQLTVLHFLAYETWRDEFVLQNYTTTDMVLYIVNEDDNGPIFCRVAYILYFNGQWHICGELLKSKFVHLHCYSVKETGFVYFLEASWCTLQVQKLEEN